MIAVSSEEVEKEVLEDAPTSSPPTKKSKRRATFFLIIFFVSFLAYFVLSKNVALRAGSYSFTITELSPITGGVIYGSVLLYKIITAWRRNRYDRRRREHRALELLVHHQESNQDDENSEELFVPWWKSATVGCCFSVYNMLFNLGNRGKNAPPGGISLLITKLVVPFSAMMGTMPPLRRRPSLRQIFALVLLLVGGAVTLIPQYRANDDDDDDEGSTKDSSGTKSMVLQTALLVAAQPVAAFAMLFVEVQVTRAHPRLSLIAFWAQICLFEALFGVIVAPINASIARISMKDIPSNMWNGVRCLFGGIDSSEDDDCRPLPLVYLSQIITGSAFNMSMAAAIRNDGATLMWFVRASTLPFGSLLFAWPFIMGEHAEKLSLYNGAGVVLVTAALVLYNTDRTAIRGPNNTAAAEISNEFSGSEDRSGKGAGGDRFASPCR